MSTRIMYENVFFANVILADNIAMEKSNLDKKTNGALLLELFGKTQAEVARATNIPPPTVSRIINGKHDKASVGHAILIARFFGLSVEQFYDRDYVVALYKGEAERSDDIMKTAMLQGFDLLSSEERDRFISLWFSMLKEAKAGSDNAIKSS